jgi:hypothetical protein
LITLNRLRCHIENIWGFAQVLRRIDLQKNEYVIHLFLPLKIDLLTFLIFFYAGISQYLQK